MKNSNTGPTQMNVTAVIKHSSIFNLKLLPKSPKGNYLIFPLATCLATIMFSLLCFPSFAQIPPIVPGVTINENSDAQREPRVTINEDSEFSGTSKVFTADVINLRDENINFNDKISSMKVDRGLKVTCYQDKGLTGAKVVFFAGIYPNLPTGWNDKISSIKIEKLQEDEIVPPVTLFSDDDFKFKGVKQRLGLGNFNVDKLIGNDFFSSIKIPAGLQVILFKDKGFEGRSITLEEGEHRLTDWNFNDQLSSIKVQLKNYTLVKVELDDSVSNDNLEYGDPFTAAKGEVKILGQATISQSLSSTLTSEFSTSKGAEESTTVSESVSLSATQNCPANTVCKVTFIARPEKKEYKVTYTYQEVDGEGNIMLDGDTKTREANLTVESATVGIVQMEEVDL